MICAIHQPDYLPYLGFFHKMDKADVFVFLDDAQYSKGDRHEWNDVKSPNGKLRLKIPLKYSFGCTLRETGFNDSIHWAADHIHKISMNYARASNTGDVTRMLASVLLPGRENLAQANIMLDTLIARGMGITTQLCSSSRIGVTTKGVQRLIDICTAIGADTYLSGTGAKDYMDEEAFTRAGIKVIYSDYAPSPYPQQWGDFLPDLSVIDFLCNCEWTDFRRFCSAGGESRG